MTTTTSGTGHGTGRSGNPVVDREDNRRTIPDRRIADPDRITPTPGNLRLLHEFADRLGETRPDEPIGTLRTLDSRTAMPILKRTMSDAQIQEARWYGGWNPDRDDYVRVNEDGDLEGLTRAQADQLVWTRRNDIIDAARDDQNIDAETMTTLDAMADRTEMPDQPDLDNPDREQAHGTTRRASRARNGGH
ncbi:hypothetical protein [Bifidobacterium callimiconis]|uniref:Uncharacterized protein n=1 Tax=Bifidobacterium callimiconis TaxID=2306973 RepID=A0A430FEK9_9BIFI|nr:hypothetical protein [Bifidobacterium callimiconis]RSX51276.1 hypothetical protein D2E23_1121 [Bifidobacterium callimiconis]